MRQLMRLIVEDQIRDLELLINMMMDDLDGLVDQLEELIEVPESEKTKQELLEEELEGLLLEYCKSANFYTEDNLTIAAITVEGCPFPLVGVAKCCPTDEFNETAGDIVSLRRALGLPVDPEQYGEPKIEKDCFNCLYLELTAEQFPCNKCTELEPNDYSMWRPQVEEELCNSCKLVRGINK